jgi:hypothetical protein
VTSDAIDYREGTDKAYSVGKIPGKSMYTVIILKPGHYGRPFALGLAQTGSRRED